MAKLRLRTKKLVASLPDTPKDLPEMPATVFEGTRQFETNIRNLLRHLKQVQKAFKRAGAQASLDKIIKWRSEVKGWHDLAHECTDAFVKYDTDGKWPAVVIELTPYSTLTAPQNTTPDRWVAHNGSSDESTPANFASTSPGSFEFTFPEDGAAAAATDVFVFAGSEEAPRQDPLAEPRSDTDAQEDQHCVVSGQESEQVAALTPIGAEELALPKNDDVAITGASKGDPFAEELVAPEESPARAPDAQEQDEHVGDAQQHDEQEPVFVKEVKDAIEEAVETPVYQVSANDDDNTPCADDPAFDRSTEPLPTGDLDSGCGTTSEAGLVRDETSSAGDESTLLENFALESEKATESAVPEHPEAVAAATTGSVTSLLDHSIVSMISMATVEQDHKNGKIGEATVTTEPPAAEGQTPTTKVSLSFPNLSPTSMLVGATAGALIAARFPVLSACMLYTSIGYAKDGLGLSLTSMLVGATAGAFVAAKYPVLSACMLYAGIAFAKYRLTH